MRDPCSSARYIAELVFVLGLTLLYLLLSVFAMAEELASGATSSAWGSLDRDILGMISAKILARSVSALRRPRMVCTDWSDAFARGRTSLRVDHHHPSWTSVVLPSLKRLEISYNSLHTGDWCVSNLQGPDVPVPASAFPNLEHLLLDYPSEDNNVSRIFEGLLPHGRIQIVRIHSAFNITGVQFEELSRLRSLTTIRLYNANHFDDDSARSLASLPCVSELALYGASGKFTDEGVRTLCGLPLMNLEISIFMEHPRNIAAVDAIAGLGRLRALYLHIREECDLNALSRLSALENLTLDVKFNVDDALYDIASLPLLKRVHVHYSIPPRPEPTEQLFGNVYRDDTEEVDLTLPLLTYYVDDPYADCYSD